MVGEDVERETEGLFPAKDKLKASALSKKMVEVGARRAALREKEKKVVEETRVKLMAPEDRKTKVKVYAKEEDEKVEGLLIYYPSGDINDDENAKCIRVAEESQDDFRLFLNFGTDLAPFSNYIKCF